MVSICRGGVSREAYGRERVVLWHRAFGRGQGRRRTVALAPWLLRQEQQRCEAGRNICNLADTDVRNADR